ncbi:unnamed protein product [Rhizoctonia solani]|uniref:Chalcone isomerase domain-containing protein n=1 Tax=Rhizoctonia solani TaxID=456999 RepID=A0A8H3GP24_9AGAM|nr:unnamed protein product [Rhizoctonia solani]
MNNLLPLKSKDVADPATSISFPTSLKLDGEPKMTLLGLGVRKVSFLGIQVYSVGFYADLSKVDSKALRLCKSPEECIHLLIQTTSCVLRIVPTRATSYTHLRDGFIRTIQARQALGRKEGSLTIEREEASTAYTPSTIQRIVPHSSIQKTCTSSHNPFFPYNKTSRTSASPTGNCPGRLARYRIFLGLFPWYHFTPSHRGRETKR